MIMRYLFFIIILFVSCDQKGILDDYPVWTPSTSYPSSYLHHNRGFRAVKGIIHIHSAYSHDGCDSQGIDPQGNVDMECINQLREAACNTRQDYIMLTDHPEHVADYEFEDLLLYQEGDELIIRDNLPVANRIFCDDGRSIIFTVGFEDRLMPVGMERHVSSDPIERMELYNKGDSDTVSRLKEVGAVVLVPHTENEERTVDYLSGLGMDGIEIYNLHANLGEDAVDIARTVSDMTPFMGKDESDPHPDLALVGFFRENTVALDKWEELLRQRKVLGVAATDVHRNSLPIKLRDNDRGDSYRRLMRWFSNVLLVPPEGELDDLAMKEALRDGRCYVIFEVFGFPSGFDFYAKIGEGRNIEMGGEVDLAEGPVIHAVRPEIIGLDPALPQPVIKTILLRIDDEGTGVVTSDTDGDIKYNVESKGVYRAEVRITPHHLEGFLGKEASDYIQEYIWIYSNPIYVR